MPASEIEWNIEICASTYAELSEAWLRLKKLGIQVEVPDPEYIVPLVGASRELDEAWQMVNQATQGLNSFLDIQEAYLERIRAPYDPVPAVAKLTYSKASAHIGEGVDLDEPDEAPTLKAQPGLPPVYQFLPSEFANWVARINYLALVGQPEHEYKSVTQPDPVWINRVNYGDKKL